MVSTWINKLPNLNIIYNDLIHFGYLHFDNKSYDSYNKINLENTSLMLQLDERSYTPIMAINTLYKLSKVAKTIEKNIIFFKPLKINANNPHQNP